MNRKISKVVFVNNTDACDSFVREAVVEAVREGLPLSEELADIFTLTIVEVEDGIRGVLNWA